MECKTISHSSNAVRADVHTTATLANKQTTAESSWHTAFSPGFETLQRHSGHNIGNQAATALIESVGDFPLEDAHHIKVA